jgi:hypothetical protein
MKVCSLIHEGNTSTSDKLRYPCRVAPTPEIVGGGVSGYVCHSVSEMAKRVKHIQISPRALRHYVEQLLA